MEVNLEIQNNSKNKKNEEVDRFMSELKNTLEKDTQIRENNLDLLNAEEIYLSSKISSIALKNLIKYKEKHIDEYLISKLNTELDKMDKNIQKKWNLQSRLYLTDAEDKLYGEKIDLISNAYFELNTLADLNNKGLLTKLKESINNHIKVNLNEYSKKYGLNKNQKNIILEYTKNEVNNIINNFAEKYFNNKSRDMVANFQNKWNEAYKNKDYDTANFFAGQIRRMYSKGIYKDDVLREKNMKTI
ncbi:MAG: hypothetical protein HFJ37_03565 [Clostridia bacterium]|nr:hypothetical protein [Clostridia bacterium]